MRPTRPSVVLSSLAALMLATPAVASGALDEAAIHAEPQYYLMSLPAAPVGEIAEAVLGEALGLPFKVDEDVDAQMRFQIDGMYAPRALAQEFGYRLWNADIALIEKPSNELWLIPKTELADALAQGATLVSPLAAEAPPPRRAIARVGPASRREQRPVADWSWLGWLVAGWAGGAATIIAGMTLRSRSRPVTPMLSAPVRAADPGSDDLVIPTFSRAPRQTT